MSNIHYRLQTSILGALWRLLAFPRAILAVGVGLAAASFLASFIFLGMNSDQDSLVSPEVPFQKTYLEHLRNFGDQEYLYIVIETGGSKDGMARAKDFADSVASRLREHPSLIREVHYSMSAGDLGSGALYFASLEEARMFAQTIASLAPSIEAWFEDGSLAGFIARIALLMESGSGGRLAGSDRLFFTEAIGLVGKLLGQADSALSGEKIDPSIFDFSRLGMRYFFTSNGMLLVMRMLPQKDYTTMEVVLEPVSAVREALEATRTEFPGVTAGLTGRPVLQADEMQSSNEDMTRASVVDTFLVAFLFLFIFRGWLRPALIMIALIIAIAWTFGFATASVGELNLLSAVFGLVIVGIGVDYGVHMMMRFVESEHLGLGTEDAVRTAVFQTGPGIVLGVACTVCGFYAMLGSDFQGLSQLGLIGGTGIILCLIAMMVILPAMLLIIGRRKTLSARSPRIISMPYLQRLFTRPRMVLAILFVVSLAGAPGLFKVHFDYNLLNLQAKGLESVYYERRLIDASDESTWYAISIADSVSSLKETVEKMKKAPSVGKVESILDYIPEHQAEKAEAYSEAAPALDRIPANVAEPAAPAAPEIISALERLNTALESLEEKLFAAGAVEELQLLSKNVELLGSVLAALRETPQKAERLSDLQSTLRLSVQDSIQLLKSWLAVKEVKLESLPESVRRVFIGKDGKFQIKIAPSGDVWDFDNLKHFVSELRKADPAVSGTPVVVLESSRLMRSTFVFAGGLTVVLICIILWLYSHSVRFVCLALLPLAAATFWLVEAMGWLGLNFNFANFFAIPILIAIGVDGGVHLIDRWEELKCRGCLFDTSTPTAVASSFVTTTTGFGGLLFAHHQGLAGLGAIMVVGSITGLFACIILLPAVLSIVGANSTPSE